MGDDCDLDCCNCDCFESDDDCCADGECCCGCGPQCCYFKCRYLMHALCCACFSEDCPLLCCPNCCDRDSNPGRRRRSRYAQRALALHLNRGRLEERIAVQPGRRARNLDAFIDLYHPDAPLDTAENTQGPVRTEQPSTMASSPSENKGSSSQGGGQVAEVTEAPSEPLPPSYNDVMSEKMKC